MHLYQPEGRFPASPHHLQAPQVPTLQDRGRCLSVPCIPFQLDHLLPSSSLASSRQWGLTHIPRGSTCYCTWTTGTFQPHHPPFARGGRTWVLCLTTSLGLIPNLPKCDLTPSQQFVFIGIAFDLNTGTTQPCPPQSGQLSMTAERLPVITGTPSGEVAMPVGPHDFLRETDQAGASPHASCSVHTPQPMVTVIRPPCSACAHYTRASSSPMVVVSSSQPHLRSAPPPASARPTPVH